jgi:hypothetical protein
MFRNRSLKRVTLGLALCAMLFAGASAAFGQQYVSIWSTNVSPQWLRFVWQAGMQQPIVDIGDTQKGIGFGVISKTNSMSLNAGSFVFVGVGIRTGGQPVLITVKGYRVPKTWGPCVATFGVRNLTTGAVIDVGTLPSSGVAY